MHTGQILSGNGTVSVSGIHFFATKSKDVLFIIVSYQYVPSLFFNAAQKFSVSALKNVAVLHIDWMPALCPDIFDVVKCAAWRFVPCILHNSMEMVSHKFSFCFSLLAHFLFEQRSIFFGCMQKGIINNDNFELISGFLLWHTTAYFHIITMINMNCALW